MKMSIVQSEYDGIDGGIQHTCANQQYFWNQDTFHANGETNAMELVLWRPSENVFRYALLRLSRRH